jgi:hypothetical protein
MDGTVKWKLPSPPPGTGLSRIQQSQINHFEALLVVFILLVKYQILFRKYHSTFDTEDKCRNVLNISSKNEDFMRLISILFIASLYIKFFIKRQEVFILLLTN